MRRTLARSSPSPNYFTKKLRRRKQFQVSGILTLTEDLRVSVNPELVHNPMGRNEELRNEKFEQEKLGKRGSWDPKPGPSQWIDVTKPAQWEEGGECDVHTPCGFYKPPMYLNPEVYPNRTVLRFPKRPQIGKRVRWGEFQGKPPYLEKFVDPMVEEVDARDSTPRPPQYTVVAQNVAPHKPGPPFHWRLHRAVASGDKKHFCRIVDPDGRVHRKKGGGWLCRRWTPRPQPRDLVNHSIKEWEEMLESQAVREAKEEVVFQKLMREVFGGMTGTEEGVMKDTTELLTRHKINHDDKQAAMYKLWERQVFHNIQNQIAKKLKKLTPDQVSKKLRYQQMRYAKEAGNRRIFRDLINEDYDPFELEKAGVHYSAKKILDPLKHDLEKEKREKVFFGEGVFHKVRTKDMLDPFYWTCDQFRATMHGHINADYEDATYKPREMIPEKWHSKDVFWNGKWGSEYWNEAFPPGGKCMDVPRPPENYEKEWRIERDMVEWSPVKNYPKLQISVANPSF